MAADTRTDAWTKLSPPRRNAYYQGKPLGVPQMLMEQLHGRLADALHQRLSLGAGVLCGLNVTAVDRLLEIEPGVAVDGWGRTIVVPGRVRLDPWGDHTKPPCCGGHKPLDRQGEHIVTLYLCYRECETDATAVTLSTCTPPECAYDTIVETWCLDVRPGPPPERPSTQELCEALLKPTDVDDRNRSRNARRDRICALLSGACTAPEDPCVPLAVALLTPDGIRVVAVCEARNRLYSNAMLFEMILCLAERLDHCCKDEPPQPAVPYRLMGAEVMDANGGYAEAPPTANPVIEVPWERDITALQFQLEAPVTPATVTPTAINQPPDTHSVLVELVDDNGATQPFPGTASVEGGGTLVRFTFVRPLPGRKPIRLRATVFGTPAAPRPALTRLSDGALLDGEPLALPTGNDTPGGNFVLEIIRKQPVELLRLLSVRALNNNGRESRLDPQNPGRLDVRVADEMPMLEFIFNQPLDPASVTPQAMNEPPERRSFKIDRISGRRQPVRSLAELQPDQRTVLVRLIRDVFREGDYEVSVIGTPDADSLVAVLRASDGQPLDGDPNALPSGNGQPGGDFTFIIRSR